MQGLFTRENIEKSIALLQELEVAGLLGLGPAPYFFIAQPDVTLEPEWPASRFFEVIGE